MTDAAAPRSLPLHIPADHPAFAGHFPGQPLLPGVSLLAAVLEAVLADPALAARVGPSPRLANAKFLAPVRPGAALEIRLEGSGRGLRFAVCDLSRDARVAASGVFEATP
ncbi:MaoC/PaaZ C-terminal domain-containing protein [Pseudorhodoferax sp. Leaf274]|uniref:MaoC/PaaZ C-terminal domain-containing protein n=1 Tax=Pseudorhodoferax sp. Leaf274 TaxID=1736318 RepID=UPI0007038F38|nr:MaoC/PaaZ C-terminal domain-containing protein [Pseudorhodoferax sp. Leaf274]KQP38972.1 hypothetical protein ASF44_11110 [Pseudorhodoferax sp. Leaf274]